MRNAWYRLTAGHHFSLWLGLLTIVTLLVAPPVFAQAPDLRTPEGILAFLKLQTMAVTWVVTLAWKYVPGLKPLSNEVTRWLSLAVFVVGAFAGHDVANAALAGAAGAPHLSTAHKWAVAIGNSTIAGILWSHWLKPSVGTALDRLLQRKPQTP